jgi:hypothetical protein
MFVFGERQGAHLQRPSGARVERSPVHGADGVELSAGWYKEALGITRTYNETAGLPQQIALPPTACVLRTGTVGVAGSGTASFIISFVLADVGARHHRPQHQLPSATTAIHYTAVARGDLPMT